MDLGTGLFEDGCDKTSYGSTVGVVVTPFGRHVQRTHGHTVRGRSAKVELLKYSWGVVRIRPE